MKLQRIEIPDHFNFKDFDIYDFDKALKLFNWELENETVVIDFSNCFHANYQALSLFVLYIWFLKTRNCKIDFVFDKYEKGASEMWKLMGAKGWSQVLFKENQNFISNEFKPLIALRNQQDFSKALTKAESYTDGFNVEYEKTLRYVISELLYNTLEHGKRFDRFRTSSVRIPSIIQFTWYQKTNELHFIVADIGIGIKQHLEQAYPGIENHIEAIKLATKYKVSGTFNTYDPYKNKDNAGVGLYISSNIIKKLHSDMHIISGDGLLHITARDSTAKNLSTSWPGTLVLVTVKVGSNLDLNLHKIMAELRAAADEELKKGTDSENQGTHYVNINNFFGIFAENKEEAINYRDKHLLKAIDEEKVIHLDFNGVKSAPHSFLSALLATPIKRLGMNSYKRIKIINAEPEIRETIDYIFDDNT